MQLKTILEYLENIEDDLGTLTERVEDLTHAHQVHKGHCKDRQPELTIISSAAGDAGRWLV